MTGVRIRRRTLPLLLAGVLSAPAAARAQEGAADSTGQATAWTWALGASIGLPQIIAVTGEKSLVPGLRLQGNLGSVLVVSAANVRLLLLPEGWTLQPYGFLGGGAAYAFAIEDLEGGYAYSWAGYGVRLAVERILVFGEISFMGGAEDLYDTAGAGAGVLFRFR